MNKFFYRLALVAMYFVSLWPILLTFGLLADDMYAFLHKMFIALAIGLVTMAVSFFLSLVVSP